MPSTSRQPRESVRFSEDVAPDSSVTLTYEVPEDATVEQLRVRIYRGAELDLEVEPFIDRSRDTRREQREPLVTYRGREFIVGDGDEFVFPLSLDVQEGEVLAVEVRNQDGTYSYDFSVDLELEYAGGTSRIVEVIGGWF
jgi:hypothetical protein